MNRMRGKVRQLRTWRTVLLMVLGSGLCFHKIRDGSRDLVRGTIVILAMLSDSAFDVVICPLRYVWTTEGRETLVGMEMG